MELVQTGKGRSVIRESCSGGVSCAVSRTFRVSVEMKALVRALVYVCVHVHTIALNREYLFKPVHPNIRIQVQSS